MKKHIKNYFFVFGLAATLPLFCHADSKETKPDMTTATKTLFAKFDTTQGSFTVQLISAGRPENR